ncbi:MAG: hypothetical protein ABSH27_09285, partial [Solirubrobacteraceae bacterium]
MARDPDPTKSGAPVPRDGLSGDRARSVPLAPSLEDTDPAGVLSALSWSPRSPMTDRQWMEHGQRLRRLGTGANWWVGDWIRYGNARYGERYKLATKLTGYDKQTLMNFAYVASRFEASRRTSQVSWSHHAELAAFEPEEQQHWLERAVVDRLSLKDLRRELRSARRHATLHLSEKSSHEPNAEPPARCPTCG